MKTRITSAIATVAILLSGILATIWILFAGLFYPTAVFALPVLWNACRQYRPNRQP